MLRKVVAVVLSPLVLVAVLCGAVGVAALYVYEGLVLTKAQRREIAASAAIRALLREAKKEGK